MDIYQATISRRSIRRYKNIPIPYDVLESLVNAARLAPTGKNRQLCQHIVIDDELLLPKIFDNVTLGAEQSLEHMPRAYVITLINSRLEKELADISQEKETGGHIISTLCGAGMAVENIILVALEQGIGACAIMAFKAKEIKQILNIPDNYDIALVLALGYPDESPVVEPFTGSVQSWNDDRGIHHVPKRAMEDIIHRNKFSQPAG